MSKATAGHKRHPQGKMLCALILTFCYYRENNEENCLGLTLPWFKIFYTFLNLTSFLYKMLKS